MWLIPAWAGLLSHVAVANEPSCPPGMVLVGGSGTVGMRGQPYGVVETAHLTKVEAPEKKCPEALRTTPGATVCWVQTDLVDPVLKPRQVHLEPFCIEAFPFPGKGHKYTKDGLNVWTVKQANDIFLRGTFGPRRLCSASEFQAAVAGIEANHRFVYGNQYDAERCQAETIGGDPKCRNLETGVYEYAAIHSHWAVADQRFVDDLCAAEACNAAGNRQLKPGMFVVMGGTKRFQTRQAPVTPHTWHDHGEPSQDACAYDGWDDQLAVCADPRPSTPTAEHAWESFQQVAIERQSLTAALSAASGQKICPD